MTGRHDLGARNAARWQYGAPGAVLLREHPGVNRGSDTMGLIAWIVVGAIAGFIATFITGTREGVLMTIVLGIVGALVGGFLAGLLLNVKDPTGINVETIVVSVIGAIIVVFVASRLFGTRGGNRTA